eukprot:TRINITY_DN288_c0_g1_i5.p1 TRINITY_DN288_c0_g1~~TRINITY_DN288_c0_g1_i5.p1  ORF type:complete len:165 (-),score=30.87 TRINITY_DN288_c0_g1_i5:30-494(-)
MSDTSSDQVVPDGILNNNNTEENDELTEEQLILIQQQEEEEKRAIQEAQKLEQLRKMEEGILMIQNFFRLYAACEFASEREKVCFVEQIKVPVSKSVNLVFFFGFFLVFWCGFWFGMFFWIFWLRVWDEFVLGIFLMELVFWGGFLFVGFHVGC